MKVGILTFPRAINYGAALQAAALQLVLRENGADASVVDYRCEAIDSTSKVFDFNQITNVQYVLAHLVNLPIAVKRQKAFQKFWNRHFQFTNTDPAYYDAIVAGSDQVWNYKLTGDDLFYYLNFEKRNTKKVAYAASFGLSEIPQEKHGTLKPLLADFDHLSVREQTAATLVEQISGQKAEVVLDPTLLLNREQWSQMSDLTFRDTGYIFVYTLFHSDSLWEYAYQLSAKTGLPIKTISNTRFHRRNAEYCFTAGPDLWLSHILNADYVVTNSFHGFAFSVNFQKQFYYELPPRSSGVGSRLSDMAERYGLTSRELRHNDESVIDYGPVVEKLEQARQESMAFIHRFLH